MSLNIKNDETCWLAGELARLTGETMTGAITVALRECLTREKRRHDAAGLAAGAARHRTVLRQTAGAGTVLRGAWQPALR